MPAATEAAVTRASLPQAPRATVGSSKVWRSVWSHAFVVPDAQAIRCLAVGNDGSLYIGGYFRGKSPFGTATEVDREADGFFAKMSKAGKLLWNIELTGPGPDTVDTIAVDNSGNVLVAGSMAETLAFGRDQLTSAGADDMFVAKYNADGKRIWAKRFGGTDVDAFHSVVTDKNGNTYATGVFRGQFSMTGRQVTSAGKADVLVIKLAADGNVAWLRSLGGSEDDYGRSLAIDSQGDVLLAGEFSDTIKLATTRLSSTGNRDILLAKFNAEGELRWAKSFGTTMDELIFDIAVDPADHIAITGSFDDTIAFDHVELTARGQADAFVARLSPDGKTQWAHGFGGEREDIGYAVDTDRFGHVFATGWLRGTVDFGLGPLKSAGKRDIYLVELNPLGKVVSADRFGNRESDLGKGIAAVDRGVVIAGTIVSDVSMGGARLGAPAQPGERIPRGDAFVSYLTRQ